MADAPKITLEELIAHPERADSIADEQVRDILRQIAERTAALESVRSQIIWRLMSFRNINSQGLPPLMNAQRLAEHLAVPESWVREQARIGELPAIKLGHYVRFRLDDVQRRIAEMAGVESKSGPAVGASPWRCFFADGAAASGTRASSWITVIVWRAGRSMNGSGKVTLDQFIGDPTRAVGLPEEDLRALLAETERRESALKALESQILWRLTAERNDGVKSDGFPRLLTAKLLAALFDVPESWLREQAQAGELPSIWVGGYLRFRLDEVKRFISETIAREPDSNQLPQTLSGNGPRLALPAEKSRKFRFVRSTSSQPVRSSAQRPALARIADLVGAWTRLLWAHAVHEGGWVSRLRKGSAGRM